MTSTFNSAVTEAATEILGKHRPKKKPCITDELLELCNKRRELKKRKSEPGGANEYREANNNVKKGMKKAKQNWIEEQCKDIEHNLTTNNSKKAYQIVKELTTVKQGKVSTIQNKEGK